MIAGFSGLTVQLFSQTTYAEQIYVTIAISFIGKLSDEKSKDLEGLDIQDHIKRFHDDENEMFDEDGDSDDENFEQMILDENNKEDEDEAEDDVENEEK